MPVSHYRGGQRKKTIAAAAASSECTAYADQKPAALLALPPLPPSPRPPPPTTTSAEASPPLFFGCTWTFSIANPSAAPQGNPGVDSDLLSRFRQVSRPEAMRMLQFLDHIRNEGSTGEDLVEKLAVEDEPGQIETTQGPREG